MTSFLLLGILTSQSQNDFSNKQKSFQVKYINDFIKLDGILDEPIWSEADSAKDFWEYFPVDSILAREQTDIKMLYDDKNLYIGITVYTKGKDYAIESLKRDFRAGNSDNITLLFDTFNDGNNAFLFGTNPYGVRREGLVSGGGLDLRGFTISWDVKWKGESKIYDNYYTSEMVIPLTSFKFREGERKWRFNSYRFDTQSNENSTWVRIPQNQNIFGLTFMGDMIFEKPLGKSRTPFAVIPYINYLNAQDFENQSSINNFKVGGDAKVSIGNSLNLDVTINPDFSQVEVDNQITNLTRFEIGLPERRQFFIDNIDLFADFGDSRDSNPFFSRRIGIARDTADNTIENSIIGGVRLSGKLNNRLRIGFLNLQTEADEANEIASNNNMMLAIQQQVFSRSNIGLFFINRQSTKDYDFLAEEDRFNRVVGVDYNLISEDNLWSGRLFLHKSFEPEGRDEDFSSGMQLEYNSRFWNFFSKAVFVGEDYQSDLGFVRRTDIFKSILSMRRIFWPKEGIIQTHSIRFFPNFIWSPTRDFQNTDYTTRLDWEVRFNDLSEVQASFSHQYTYLLDEFDPTRSDDALALPGEQGYYYNSVNFRYRSDRRRILSYSIEPTIGRFFNGDRFSLEGGLNLRLQPKAIVSMNFRYDQIQLPEPYGSANIWLISPRFDLTFSKSIFWSTLIQYSNQRDNLGINSRLQWRFAPLSDLFLVYNDNYFVNSFMPKLRSINLKLTYWLNI
ncbi:MAG: carbohydrate binding family 9 domain-containing protein [Flavobacteriaceae bacterium]|nr:carbohydrate binding family 9 domain-containing protein [Muriicola sp.]NNC62975.1 carbohydrate binding family 9 domain-containing protein [Eudoraea sp.]NNL39106.1 carbohydrate binding family 9 domain-containing protein [Flavobacteriaceae bacterium]